MCKGGGDVSRDGGADDVAEEDAAVRALRALVWVDSPACRGPPEAAEPGFLPPKMGECIWVDTAESLASMARGLAGCSEVALDLEHHSYRSYHGLTCLVQVSTRSQDFLVDAMALRGAQLRDALGPVLEDPGIVKVLHGAAHDVLWMQKDFAGMRLVHVFDTGEAARVLKLPKHGLGYLMSQFAGVPEEETEDKKRFQVADWRSRPLSVSMQRYAQADTHFLLHIYDRLRMLLARRRAELQERQIMRRVSSADWAEAGAAEEDDASGEEVDPFEDVMERSRDLCLRTYSEAVFSSTDWLDAMYKANGGKRLAPSEAACFEALYAWRDATARAEDESVSYVLSHAHLLALARARPMGVAATLGVLQGPARRGRAREIPERLRRRAEEIASAITAAPMEPLADMDSWVSPAKRKRARAHEASLERSGAAAPRVASLVALTAADTSVAEEGSGDPKRRRGTHTRFESSDVDSDVEETTPDVDVFSDADLLVAGDPESPRQRAPRVAKFDDAFQSAGEIGSLILALPPPLEPFAMFIPSDEDSDGSSREQACATEAEEKLIPDVIGERTSPKTNEKDTEVDVQAIRNPGLRQALDDLRAKRERGQIKKLRNDEASPMGEMVPMSVKERGQGARRHDIAAIKSVTKELERTREANGADKGDNANGSKRKRFVQPDEVVPFDFEQARRDQVERARSKTRSNREIKREVRSSKAAKSQNSNSFTALKLIEGMRPGRSSRTQPRSGNRAG